MASSSTTPVEDTIRRKFLNIPSQFAVGRCLTLATGDRGFEPHKPHHSKRLSSSFPPQGHGRLDFKGNALLASLDITSPSFQAKPQPARHRMIYSLLKEELDRPGGIHALQLRTKTPEEVERELARKKDAQGAA
ncbi:BolA domain protein [Fonsecaea pedrosoi]|nr:BolA domain protein [Fonsecaea pedrosoi]